MSTTPRQETNEAARRSLARLEQRVDRYLATGCRSWPEDPVEGDEEVTA